MSTMTKMIDITVPADSDADDCLTTAVDAYVEHHPELRGWDLSPRWTDENDRETITLTVPEDA